MTARLRVSGQLKTVKRHRVRVAGALRTVARRSIYVAGELRSFYASNPVASITPNPAHKSSVTSPVTYKPVCIVTGGALPISYSWTLLAIDNEAPPPSISGGETSSPSLSIDLLPGATVTCTYRCSITDALGNTASADVQITFERVIL